MNDVILTQIDKEVLVDEIADAVVSRLLDVLPAQEPEDELIQIPEVMKLLGRSRTTINNWRKEGFLREHVFNTRVYFKKSEVMNAGRQKNGFKK
ncbi:helix-turn-helix domain-containing protein [Echinicola marina]|uniref:helix-turn-helix transcriptional regulator n=1 Tax=Echinicola marina TaxID=2859768 RepID=UPI001CF61302|nr:helix-turn-helix domain-containing protein [Echinicola marina]UCS93841.1 helix-turn-helix domain-containing protein [Echinicola marina]